MNFFKFKSPDDESWKNVGSIYDFVVKDIDGNDISLDKYRGKVLLIVNVASNCGFTAGHYKDLNELHDKHAAEGLSILGFPCNQFGGQEPGCSVDIKEFIKKKGVQWDMFDKVNVNGNDAIPLYKWLKNKAGGFLGIDAIKWNFTKFLVNRQGQVVSRHAPTTSAASIEGEIVKELEKSADS
ncbi:putative glutathione peroxidase 7, chloroplastic, partial [Fragariocoptes setiger]